MLALYNYVDSRVASNRIHAACTRYNLPEGTAGHWGVGAVWKDRNIPDRRLRALRCSNTVL